MDSPVLQAERPISSTAPKKLDWHPSRRLQKLTRQSFKTFSGPTHHIEKLDWHILVGFKGFSASPSFKRLGTPAHRFQFPNRSTLSHVPVVPSINISSSVHDIVTIDDNPLARQWQLINAGRPLYTV